jgi:hypothetical protein
MDWTECEIRTRRSSVSPVHRRQTHLVAFHQFGLEAGLQLWSIFFAFDYSLLICSTPSFVRHMALKQPVILTTSTALRT